MTWQHEIAVNPRIPARELRQPTDANTRAPTASDNKHVSSVSPRTPARELCQRTDASTRASPAYGYLLANFVSIYGYLLASSVSPRMSAPELHQCMDASTRAPSIHGRQHASSVSTWMPACELHQITELARAPSTTDTNKGSVNRRHSQKAPSTRREDECINVDGMYR